MNEQSQQPIQPCPNCGGQLTTVRPQTVATHSLEVIQPKRKTGVFSGKSNISSLGAFACTNCGYTMLFALRPSNLLPDEG